MIKAYTNLNSFSGKSKFSTWLFRIAYNCFCDNKRAGSRYTTSELNDNLIYSSDTTDSKYKNQELYMALQKLNENERSCILLFYMEDKSIKDISDITGIKENRRLKTKDSARGCLPPLTVCRHQNQRETTLCL